MNEKGESYLTVTIILFFTMLVTFTIIETHKVIEGKKIAYLEEAQKEWNKLEDEYGEED